MRWSFFLVGSSYARGLSSMLYNEKLPPSWRFKRIFECLRLLLTEYGTLQKNHSLCATWSETIKKSIYHCKVYKVHIINIAKTFWFWWVCQPLYLKLTVFASLNFPPLHYCRPPNKWKDITQQIKGQERVGGFFNIFVSSWENLL